ncbi:spore germination protein [Paenibacillus lycopersici]|uniref:Spore germination protein n=1 Tax=Paenibacillus lycopersici TaxID=2704462 RepID=A0A6C0G3D3_9BACL|nr:spore germination protein [Paenibacillus lycopersici]QHT61160.1 spore germination protein [Paenibacillus lycopersici]
MKTSAQSAFIHQFERQPDFNVQRILVDSDIPVTCCYLDTIVDTALIEKTVLSPLLDIHIDRERPYHENRTALIRDKLSSLPCTEEKSFAQWVSALHHGQCIIFIAGIDAGYLLSAPAFPHRNIQEPKTEKTVRGPSEAFTEAIMTNVGLVRSRIKSPQLVFETFEIGELSCTKVLMGYVQGKASEARIQAYRERIGQIRTEAVFEGANIEEWIEDKELTPFPRMLNTERPDIASAHLVEGKILIFTDGTPSSLITPVSFFQFFVSAEDYYQQPLFATLLRWLRFLSFLLSVYTPSIFIALSNYNQEMIPSELLINLAAQREGVPFPAFVEALIMLVMFELLREAGVRMPSVTGQAISIVGAVVLGQAAVEAGLVSAAMVIVVGITAMANFVSPSFNFGMAQRILQFSFMVLAVSLGMFGILCGTLALVVHLVSLKTTGEPYLSPLAPIRSSEFRDTLFRVPWYKMKEPRNAKKATQR